MGFPGPPGAGLLHEKHAMSSKKIFAGISALALIGGLAACSSVTTARPAVTVTHTVTVTVTAKPAPAKTHSARPKVNATPAVSPALPRPDQAQVSVPDQSGIDPAKRAVEPSAISTSADGNGGITGITWSSWTAYSAEGSGSISLNNCDPNCAPGTRVSVPVSIALSSPVNGSFTVMTVKDHAGNADTYNFSSGTNTYGLGVDDPAPATPAIQSNGLPTTGVWYPWANFPNIACGPPTAETSGLNTSYIDETGNGFYTIDTDDPTSSPCNS